MSNPARNAAAYFYGYRIACTHAKKTDLVEFLAKTYEQGQLSDAAVKKIVADVRSMDWGVMRHGGARRGEKYAMTVSAKHAERKSVAIKPRFRHKRKKPLKQACGGGDSGMVAIGTEPPRKKPLKQACGGGDSDVKAIGPGTGPPQCGADLVAIGTGPPHGGVSDTVAVGTGGDSDSVAIGTRGSAMVSSNDAQKGSSLGCGPVCSGSSQQELTCTFGLEVRKRIGKGVFGQVFEARGANGDLVAIKHMPCKPGAKLTTMQRREVDALKKLQGHPNVIKLLNVNMTCFSVELVFELAENTLRDCIKNNAPIDKKQVVGYTMDLFNGLQALHQNDIIHRDIKPSNLLIARGVLLISDFGWARELSSAIGDDAMERNAYSLWWRPPEVLLGSATYGFSADVWAAGCVCVEMCEGKPAFAGKSEDETLQLQLKKLGTPSNEEWPGMFRLPGAKSLQYFPTRPWSSWGERAGSRYTCLLKSILTIVPIHRNTASMTWSVSRSIMEAI